MIFKRLFGRRENDGDGKAAKRRSRRHRATRTNTAEIYRRAMRLSGHPEVSERDRGSVSSIITAAGMVEVNSKHREWNGVADNLKFIDELWSELMERYEHIAYPELFPASDSDLTHIAGTSIQKLRKIDPMEAYLFTMTLLNSGDYDDEATECLVRARAAFMEANRPPSIPSGSSLAAFDRGINRLIEAETHRLKETSPTSTN